MAINMGRFTVFGMRWHMRCVQVENLIISGDWAVQREAHPLVLLNSLGTSHSSWAPVVDQLNGSPIRYDMRGHGLSDGPPGPYSIEMLAEDLIGLLDALDVERVVLCGLSIGGMVAMQTAAMAPERLRGLVLCDTTLKMPEPAMWTERARQAREEGLDELADAAIERWFTPEFRKTPFARGIRNMVARTSPEGYAGCCEAIGSMDLEEAARSIRVPTRVFVGEHDPATPVAAAEAICAAIPQAQLTVMPGLYHLGCIERPDLFAPELERFVAEVS